MTAARWAAPRSSLLRALPRSLGAPRESAAHGVANGRGGNTRGPVACAEAADAVQIRERHNAADAVQIRERHNACARHFRGTLLLIAHLGDDARASRLRVRGVHGAGDEEDRRRGPLRRPHVACAGRPGGARRTDDPLPCAIECTSVHAHHGTSIASGQLRGTDYPRTKRR
eukprot:6542923-Prymnesium_polylepis.1